MASRKENLKSLMVNSRTRLMIVLTAVVLVIGVVVGFMALHKQTKTLSAGSGLRNTPGGISATPGALNQTAEYQRIQNSQNQLLAQEALKKGGSAIPTIVDLKKFGDGITTVGPTQGRGGVGWGTLANLDQGIQKPIWMQDLLNSHCDKTSYNEALNSGAGLSQLKEYCSCEQLKSYNYELSKLITVCHCGQLRQLGTTALEFRNIGYGADKLRICGYSACELKGAGYSAADLKNAGYSDGELAGAGYSDSQIASTSGLPNGMSAQDVKNAGCSVDALRKLRQQGVSAAAIRRISGCDVSALKAAGFTAAELKDAGYTPAELKAAGFTADELKKAGFDTKALLDAGFTPDELIKAGVSAEDIESAQNGLPPGISAADVRKSGCNIDALKRERAAGVSAAAIVKIAGCSLDALKAAGFTPAELKAAGFTAEQLRKAGFSPEDLLDAGFTPDDLAKAGFTPQEIENAKQALPPGITANDLRAHGCSIDALRKEKALGVSAATIMGIAHCSADVLRQAGFTPAEIEAALEHLPLGISVDDIKKNGCTAEAIKRERDAGVSAQAIMHIAGCNPQQLAAGGFTPKEISGGFSKAALAAGEGQVSADEIRKRGCSIAALQQERAQGISAAAVMQAASCSAEDLKAAGYSDADVANALRALGLPVGVNPADVKKNGCSVEALQKEKAQGVSAAAIMKFAGCSPDALKAAGFSAQEIADAVLANGLPPGMSADDVKKNGCSVEALQKEKAQGVSAAAIMKFAGCSPDALKAAGFSPQEIADAMIANGLPPGVSADDVKKNGCSVEALQKEKAQGVSAAAIMKFAGCSPDALKAAGFSAADIAQAQNLNGLPAGISPDSVKNSGCSLAAIQKEKAQGVSAAAIMKFAGCSPDILKAAGYSADEVTAALQGLSGFCPIQDVISAACDPVKLIDLKKINTSAAKIIAVSHCSVEDLKQAGYTPSELLSSGIDAQELQQAGFSESEIAQGYQDISQAKNINDAQILAVACDSLQLAELRRYGVKAARIVASNHCTAQDLKNAGFSAGDILSSGFAVDELQKLGYSSEQIQKAQVVLSSSLDTSDQAIRSAGCDKSRISQLAEFGIQAVRIAVVNHCSAADLHAAGYGWADILASGFSASALKNMGVDAAEIQQAENELAAIKSEQCPAVAQVVSTVAPSGVDTSDAAVTAAGCDPRKLAQLRASGVSAEKIMQLNHCSLDALKAAGFTPSELLSAGFTPEQLQAAGFSPADIASALNNPILALANGKAKGCSLEVAIAARKAGMSAADLRKTLGCSAANLLQAGYTPAELKAAGFTAGELAKAGVPLSELIKAGFSPSELKSAGFSAKDLLAAGFSPKDLVNAGFKPDELLAAGLGVKQLLAAGVSPDELKKMGYTATDLKNAGLSAEQLAAAGFTPMALKAAGFTDAEVNGLNPSAEVIKTAASIPNLELPSSIAKVPGSRVEEATKTGFENLAKTLEEQKKAQAAMKFQQKIQQKTASLFSYASQVVQGWKAVATQTYVAGTVTDKSKLAAAQAAVAGPLQPVSESGADVDSDGGVFIKSGDIVFAVIDTAVNTDEPSPILATIVSGPLKGSKLIGSFNLPGNASKMIITFTSMSVQGITKTVGISAYAIDPNTGRTALSSSTNHHYLERYGALFAATFLEGFGNAFQSADTTITIGGTGGTGGPNTTTVQNGIGRSLTSNAVIGLATLGKAWGQQAQQNMNIPTTVQVYSGTPIGVLFLQDVTVDSNQTK